MLNVHEAYLERSVDIHLARNETTRRTTSYYYYYTTTTTHNNYNNNNEAFIIKFSIATYYKDYKHTSSSYGKNTVAYII